MVPIQGKEEVRALTGFRFVAAIFVFVFHIHIRWPLVHEGYLSNLLSQGAVGMTMFFMLSGFILAYRYSGERFNTERYFLNRFARIYPIYFVAAVSSLPILVMQMHKSFLQIGSTYTILQAILLTICGLLMIQAWIPMMFSYWNNNASWSLSAEAFFYSVFSFIYVYIRNMSRLGLVVLLAVLYVFDLIPVVSYYVFDNRPATLGIQIFYAMPIFRVSEFVIGIVLFVLWSRRRRLKDTRLAWITAILFMVSIAYLAVVGRVLPIFVGHNWIAIPAIACALVVLSSGGGYVGKILSSSIFVWLGRVSYCFYSFQVHVLFVIGYLGSRLDLSPSARFTWAFVMLLAISAGGYHFIEEPARRWLQRRYRRDRLPVAVTGVTVR